VLYKTYIRN